MSRYQQENNHKLITYEMLSQGRYHTTFSRHIMQLVLDKYDDGSTLQTVAMWQEFEKTTYYKAYTLADIMRKCTDDKLI